MSKHSCNCNGFVIIFLKNGDPIIAKSGENEVPAIKKLLGIPEIDTLFEVVGNGTSIKFDDSKKIHLKGCEIFYGVPPGAGNSKEEVEKVLLAEPFENIFGKSPTLVREAGEYVLIMEQLPVGNGKMVDVALEWPKKPRLLFSERFETPNRKDANWAYPSIMIGGRVWQGVSLQTKESTPLTILLSYLAWLL